MIRSAIIPLTALCLASLGILAPAALAHFVSVVVVSPQRGLPYSDMVRGIADTVTRHDGSTATHVYLTTAGGLTREDEATLREAAEVIVIGSQSQDVVRRVIANRANVNVTACAALSVTTGPAVRLRHAPEEVLRRVQQLLPRTRTIGVLLSDGASPAEIDALRARARQSGLTIETVTVDSDASIERGISRLSDLADVIVSTQDLAIYTPDNAQRILTSTLRHRIPFMGPSEPWTRAGALAALDWDWPELGRQCAELSLRSGHDRTQGIEHPRRAPLSINLRTARYLRITIPPAVLREAHRTYE